MVPQHVVLVGGDVDNRKPGLAGALHQVSLPGVVVQRVCDPTAIAQSSPAHGKDPVDNRETAYVCVGQSCSTPVTDQDSLVSTLKTLRHHGV